MSATFRFSRRDPLDTVTTDFVANIFPDIFTANDGHDLAWHDGHFVDSKILGDQKFSKCLIKIVHKEL